MVTQTEKKQIKLSSFKAAFITFKEEHYKKNSKCTFNPDLVQGWTDRIQDSPVINPAVSTRDHKSHCGAFKVSDID